MGLCSNCRASIPTRRRSGPICPFGVKYTKRGMSRNTKHRCGPECSWDADQVRDWLNTTPYTIKPGVQIMPKLVPVPPCRECDRPRRDHYVPVADANGRLRGFAPIKECSYIPQAA